LALYLFNNNFYIFAIRKWCLPVINRPCGGLMAPADDLEEITLSNVFMQAKNLKLYE
jgi:hypothetical protein